MGQTGTVKGIELQKTPKGARFDIRVYVYPDGHANVVDGRSGTQTNAPAANELELVNELVTLVGRAYNLARSA